MDQELIERWREIGGWSDEIAPHPRVERTIAEWRALGVPDYWLDRVWKQYVAGPDHGDAFYCDSPELPRESGVYFLWTDCWGLLYVGMSSDIGSRAAQHLKDVRLRFRYVTYLPVDYDLAPYIEKVYIDALCPPGNRKYDCSHWPGHDWMVRLVERIWRRRLLPSPTGAPQ